MKTFKIRNVVKAVQFESKWTKTVCVKFPVNDYMVAGRVWSGAPVRHLKPAIVGDEVRVRFNNSIWGLRAHAWIVTDYDEATKSFLPLRNSAGRRYKARISFDPIHILDLR